MERDYVHICMHGMDFMTDILSISITYTNLITPSQILHLRTRSQGHGHEKIRKTRKMGIWAHYGHTPKI